MAAVAINTVVHVTAAYARMTEIVRVIAPVATGALERRVGRWDTRMAI